MKKFQPVWHSHAAAADEAARVLPRLMRHFFEHGDRVVEPGTSAEKLHEFRLASKRARYTLELFEPIYGPALRGPLAGIKKVQQVLGELNDCEASLQLIDGLPEAAGPVNAAWIEAIQVRRDRKRGEFTKMWLGEFSDAALREGWLNRLAEPK